MKTIAHVSYKNVTPQMKALFDKLALLDSVAVDLALGDSVTHPPERLGWLQHDIDEVSHKWCTEILGGNDAFYIDDGIGCLKALLERNIEADREPTDEEAREIYHEDKTDHLRAMGG